MPRIALVLTSDHLDVVLWRPYGEDLSLGVFHHLCNLVPESDPYDPAQIEISNLGLVYEGDIVDGGWEPEC